MKNELRGSFREQFHVPIVFSSADTESQKFSAMTNEWIKNSCESCRGDSEKMRKKYTLVSNKAALMLL